MIPKLELYLRTEPKAAHLEVPKANETSLSNTILEGVEMLNFIKLILYSRMSKYLIASVMEDIISFDT